MFITELRWNIKVMSGIVKVVGIAPLQENSVVNNQVQTHMINKMVELLEQAEKLEGKPLSIQPNFPNNKNTIYILIAVFFHLSENLEEFIRQSKIILRQG